MTTAELALRGIVNKALIPQRWRDAVGKFDIHKWATTFFAGTAAAVVVWTQVLGGPSLLTGQSKDIQALQAQQNVMASQLSALQAQVAPLAQLSIQIDRLTQRFDQAPHTDLLNSQLTEIQRHLSALDGRMDGMDTRVRADEDRGSHDNARIDAIENASKSSLGNHR